MRRLPSRHWTDARFDKLVWVETHAVTYYQDVARWDHPRIVRYRPAAGMTARRFVMANTGKVVDGEWDRDRMAFEENEVYRLLHERFAQGREWHEIGLFRKYVAEIAAGTPRWRHSASYDELLATANEVERLYREIRDRGYRPSQRSGPRADEVTVSIGRDGELLFNNVGGHHRLSIAKLLGIEQVPVRVLLRHRQWQDVRNELRRRSRPGSLSARARRYVEHPDLRDLLAGS